MPAANGCWSLGSRPPIVSEDVFRSAQARFSLPRLRQGKAKEPYLLKGHAKCAECWGPLIGTVMNKRYRYYRCRGAWPTSTRPRTCDTRYISADKLEGAVWREVMAVLETPDIVIGELRRLRKGANGSLDSQIEKLETEIKSCEAQERRLVALAQYEDVDVQLIHNRQAPLKALREGYESDLRKMKSQRKAAAEGAFNEELLRRYCRQVRERLGEFGREDRRLTLAALQIKATVSQDSVDIRGVLGASPPPKLITIERTSA